LVMNSLLPSSTNESPSRRAVVRTPATSEPAPASVTATAVSVAPLTIPGSQRDFCSSVPALTRCGDAMSVCTSTVTMKPPYVDCDNASANAKLVSASRSAPPYASGTIRPSQPSSPIRRSTPRGTQPSRSHASP
jgi:hypothetical protein